MSGLYAKSTHWIPRFDTTRYLSEEEFREVKVWCRMHFGLGGGGSDLVIQDGDRWCFNSYQSIWLRNADDAFHFKMRWC